MNDISHIIARWLLKAASKKEEEKLFQWKAISEKNKSFIEGMDAFRDQPVTEKPDKRLEPARKRLSARLAANLNIHPERSLISYWKKIAAAVILFVSLSGLSIYMISGNGFLNRNDWIVISTEAGQQSKISLPDGSVVWLNAETELKYHTGKTKRIVNLSGEAYFEVTHASDRPFIVETENAQIKVLGTKFDVSHYPQSKNTETSLLTGKITMFLPDINKELELRPGQKVLYNTEKQTFMKTTAKVQNEISWRQGILVFDNKSFNDLIQELERYYAVKFIYKKESFENIHYTGTIDNLSINKVLEFISLTIPVRYEIDNKTIKLKSPVDMK